MRLGQRETVEARFKVLNSVTVSGYVQRPQRDCDSKSDGLGGAIVAALLGTAPPVSAR